LIKVQNYGVPLKFLPVEKSIINPSYQSAEICVISGKYEMFYPGDPADKNHLVLK
jgi:hypothetical protein